MKALASNLRIICVLLFLVVSLILNASEFITTVRGNRMEVKLIEMNDSIITYHLINDVDLVSHKILVSTISMIELSNGTIWRFNAALKTYVFENYPKVDKIGRRKYRLGDTLLSNKEYLNFLSRFYPKAYSQYVYGRNLKRVGWTFLATGPALIILGSSLLNESRIDCDLPYPHEDRYNSNDETVGLLIVGCGAAFLASSIPFIIVGNCKVNKSYSVYQNERRHALRTNTIELVPYVAPQGLGVAINF